MEMAFLIGAGTLGALAIYKVVSQDSRVRSLESKLAADGFTVKIKFTKPTKPGQLHLQGTVSSTKLIKQRLSGPQLKDAFVAELNKVDQREVGLPITLIDWKDKKVSLDFTANTFGVVVKNKTGNTLYPQLFQGFEANSESAMAVAWQISDNPISNGSQGKVQWQIQYVMVAGRKSDNGFSVSIEPVACALGDHVEVKFEGNDIKLSDPTPTGTDGTISFHTGPDFPTGWYVGFGIMNQTTGESQATGVVNIYSESSFVFTPYEKYSVNLTDDLSTNLYGLQATTDFATFQFSGSNNWAHMVFDDNGWEDPTFSNSPSLASTVVAEQESGQHNFRISTTDGVQQVIINFR